jgi:hypothetical protein
MGFFYKLRLGIARFMYGRNGVDQLSQAAVLFSLLVQLLGMLLAWRWVKIGNVLYYVGTVLWLWPLFRIFSKNLAKRRAENQKWLTFWGGLRSRRASARARHADKDHKYFTCKHCGTICRVPAGKGKIIITCPKCGAQIQGKS